MRCPYCGFNNSKVVDSRPGDEGRSIRRRRECLSCERRFTTYEKFDEVPIVVKKKDGNREVFDVNKLSNGLIRACEKRPVALEDIQNVVRDIEISLNNAGEREVSSIVIGEMAMDALKKIDQVAYVRFASVYREFKDIETFMEELNHLINHDGKNKNN